MEELGKDWLKGGGGNYLAWPLCWRTIGIPTTSAPFRVFAMSGCAPHKQCIFSLIHRSHSISFTRAQGIPRYKIGLEREKDGRVGRDWLRGVGVTVPVTGGGGNKTWG